MIEIELQNISIEFPFPKTEVLKNVNLQIQQGEVVALLGYSGAGKSTLIKLIASFLKPTLGKVLISGKDLVKGHPNENLGYLCQASEKMLFPWLTVEQHLHYPLKLRKRLDQIGKTYCEELLYLLNLTHRKKSYPQKLSGGEQKRLCMAMVLSYKPEIILLDEPFAGLDLELTKTLWDILYQELKDRKPTVFFVTHSIDEAALLADRAIFITKSKSFLQGFKTALEFNIPNTLPRYLLVNNNDVVRYKQYLLGLFNNSINE